MKRSELKEYRTAIQHLVSGDQIELPREAHETIHAVNPALLYGLRRYFLFGDRVGGFLTEIIENNFVGAVGRADLHNQDILPQFGIYLANYPERAWWGSETTRIDWQEGNGLADRADSTDELIDLFHRYNL
mgnify:CR=1 FL=1